MISLPPTMWDALGRLRALVIGDAMLDSYFSGSSQRLCQEAPVPIVDVSTGTDMPGGAANCAANLAALGLQTTLLALSADDCAGRRLQELLTQKGVRTQSMIISPERSTLHKARVLCDDHLVVRFDQGTTAAASAIEQRLILRRLEAAYRQADLVVVSDYGYGVATPATIERLAALQCRFPRVLVVDAKNLAAYRCAAMTACKPNYRQTLSLLGLAASSSGQRRADLLASEGHRILETTCSRVVAVTLDCEGALIFERGRPPYRTYAQAAPQNRATGAGDTFLSAFASSLALKFPTPAAAEIASAAAAVAVAKPHTATCAQEELRDYLIGTQLPQSSLRRLLPILDEYRRAKRRIVLTNGCFDILHRGHVAYLSQARHLGDVLVVGVNSDDSIRRLKGPNRPINSLADRMSMLAALAGVDHVVSFDEDVPHRLIEAVRPDVFVKGGDYSRETLPEADLVERLGGTVKIIPFAFDRSTTRIIKHICQAYGPEKKVTSFDRGSPYERQGVAVGPSAALR